MTFLSFPQLTKLKKNWWLFAAFFVLVLLIIYLKPSKNEVVEKVQETEVETTPQPSPPTSPLILKEDNNQIAGEGQIIMKGKRTGFKLNIPVNGGSISGSTSGFCNGNIGGAFDSATNFVHGELSGICGGMESTGSFTREIILSTKEGSGTFQGISGGISKSENWALKINSNN